ncbi:MAG: hypothetical protein JO335_01720 [Sphingomonas sp.]|nr:hypothetical protein [Sphingomonas sp.]
MAVENDEIGLPDVPPPRPAGRDAAIQTALRKFDGIEEPVASPAARPWVRTHRTQLGVALSALTLLVVGVPAAMIGLRNQPPAFESAPTTTEGRAKPAPKQASVMAQAEPTPASPVSVNGNAPLRKNRGGFEPAAGDVPAALAEVPAAPVQAPALAAAPPPPPPPPPPAPANEVAKAERQADQATDSQELVVTGTVIRTPGVSAFERRPVRDTGRSLSGANTTNAKAKEAGYPAFLARLQTAVRADDRAAILGLINYPLRVNGSRARIYRDAASVSRDFDRIFTAKVRRAILAQKAGELFVRDQGAMIGDGEVWFDQTCADGSCSTLGPVRIKAINP